MLAVDKKCLHHTRDHHSEPTQHHPGWPALATLDPGAEAFCIVEYSIIKEIWIPAKRNCWHRTRPGFWSFLLGNRPLVPSGTYFSRLRRLTRVNIEICVDRATIPTYLKPGIWITERHTVHECLDWWCLGSGEDGLFSSAASFSAPRALSAAYEGLGVRGTLSGTS